MSTPPIFRIHATLTLAPHRPLHVEAYDESCEKFVQAVSDALDVVVEEYADLGDWVTTVEGTQ